MCNTSMGNHGAAVVSQNAGILGVVVLVYVDHSMVVLFIVLYDILACY